MKHGLVGLLMVCLFFSCTPVYALESAADYLKKNSLTSSDIKKEPGYIVVDSEGNYVGPFYSTRSECIDKNQSKNGILSVCLGAAALFLTGGIFAAAYLKSGQAGKTVAVLGFLALLLSVGGLYYGSLGLKEEDVYRLFPYLGLVINGAVLAVYVLIYVLGW